MLAIPISAGNHTIAEKRHRAHLNKATGSSRSFRVIRIIFIFFTLLICANVFADEAKENLAIPVPGESAAAVQARQAFVDARSRYESNITNNDAAWQFARACFDFAEFAQDKPERAHLAQLGMAAARNDIERDPKSAQGHYYLGMNMGQLARTETLGALRLVREMETEFSKARELDEHLDYAGPDRNLGLLYRDAPSFASIGNKNKARLHLRESIALAPDYPENRLNWIETCLKWDDRAAAAREMQSLENLLPQAKKQFTGEKWKVVWDDWETRISAAKEKIGEKTKPIKSPRAK
jgi:tetratricopeptide (TPR) repeat protein